MAEPLYCAGKDRPGVERVAFFKMVLIAYLQCLCFLFYPGYFFTIHDEAPALLDAKQGFFYGLSRKMGIFHTVFKLNNLSSI